ncbi:MAG: ATP-dependent helicase HrpA [Solirubrobacteraceae bacterium]|nr:ATP-dependent helicase HrpA [Solirubrobacteraceae bacterium]
MPTISYPPELPVSAHREQLLEVLGANQVVVVAGETGSGKTTQLPKLLLELGRGVQGTIAHTQPRRLAARTVAQRIADELGVPLGGAVGYAVRFSDRSSDETLVRLMTDGLLLAEIQRDRLLRRYDTIVVDEAHERSLNIDFLLGYLHRLLPQRPDLKLVITSATIDPDRFSRHFGDAPIVEVSGRTYPVEVRYRAGEAARDQVDAIGDAVGELAREGPGDVLVFLSGEREIRETAEALSGRLGDRVEVLPLYSRLSSADQQRIFKPHRGRRIVLATNVAETSLTVPGIHYVVDPGTARVSRYSARLKVQRLPIEPISQASAEQRKGRCGRTAAGVCIRLYAEDDFNARPEFTEPEILRTSLASVILQMAALGLGDVEDFPFLDPPDRRQVRDGVALLQELGALDDAGGLTAVGRRLAQLPVDPRMGRMVLEAGRLGCADEVTVIAAALSIQDPRERPADQEQAADAAHARFAGDGSDFLAYLRLWEYINEQQRELSGSAFRRRCKAEFLHVLRIREWQDLVEQLRRAARSAGVKRNQTPAEPEELHIALLAGLLSHVGLKDERGRDYTGARGARFALWPGSSLASKPPSWVVVAELVETARLWGRTAARVEPAWIEPIAGHVVRRTYSEPRWDRARGSVVATERVTLYGLPIVEGRTVPYGAIDPVLARELFIRRALVERDWETRHAFFAENGRLLAEVEALEDRLRRRDLAAADEALVAFFDERIPADVVSGRHFDRWWKDARGQDPSRLTFPRALLLGDADADVRGRPEAWKQGDLVLPLSYRFVPGSDQDGVTVRVPLRVLPQLRAVGFDWLVPALRPELVTSLLRTLPKDLRRALAPIPATAAALLEDLQPRREPLLAALTRELERVRGVRVPEGAWDPSRLEPHLRMRFAVEDERGRVVAEGEDLEALRAQVRPLLRAELSSAAAGLERHGMRAWEAGTLPRVVTLEGTGDAVRSYPALADEGETVGVRVLDTPQAQERAMRAGTRRLLALTIPSPLRWVRDQLDSRTQLALAAAPHGSLEGVLDDALGATIDALVERAGGPAWDEAAFAALRAHVAGELADEMVAVLGKVAVVLGAAREVELRLERLPVHPFEEAREDISRQLGRLLHPGFINTAGVGRLDDLTRYLRAAARRLDRLPDATAVDRDRMRTIRELEAEHQRNPRPDVGWLLEELRVSQFAQGLGTREPVSAKRIRRLLAE